GATAALIAQDHVASLHLAPEWPVIVVPDPLRGLQALARRHRREHFQRVLAITGSNGKTIVKDALKALLAGRELLASPGSYNSQRGLPLAVLSAEKPAPLAILEVGISIPGEMDALSKSPLLTTEFSSTSASPILPPSPAGKRSRRKR